MMKGQRYLVLYTIVVAFISAVCPQNKNEPTTDCEDEVAKGTEANEGVTDVTPATDHEEQKGSKENENNKQNQVKGQKEIKADDDFKDVQHIFEYTDENGCRCTEYRVIYQARPWDQAKVNCEFDGGKLAVPKSEGEFRFMNGLVKRMHKKLITGTSYDRLLWLGISNREDYKVWKNVDGIDIRESGYHRWAPRNGDNNIIDPGPYADSPSNPRCAGLDDQPGLREWWCNMAQPYICERSIRKEPEEFYGQNKKPKHKPGHDHGTKNHHGNAPYKSQTLHGNVPSKSQTLHGNVPSKSQMLHGNVPYKSQTLYGNSPRHTQMLHGNLLNQKQSHLFVSSLGLFISPQTRVY